MSRRSPARALPVLLPSTAQAPANGGRQASGSGLTAVRHGLVIVAVLLLGVGIAPAQDGHGEPPVLSVLLKWIPLLLSGFVFNLLISALAMAGGTVVGAFLGLLQISLLPPVRAGSWFVTQFFRNAPWLVLLFFCTFLLPFQLDLGVTSVPFPDWVKATIGLALPVMANVSEIVRGAVRSIPGGQWEAAESLAFSRRQTMWMIILPQCIKRMLPPWMNLYAILTMATVLASIVGVNEVMTLTRQALGAEGGRPDLLVPFYAFDLLLFFIYCYPLARWTVRLERRYAVKI